MPDPTIFDSDFKAWPLHDAILHRITVEWEARTCRADIEAFLAPGSGQTAVRYRIEIEWAGIRRVALGHIAPWGPSVCINRHWQGGDHLFVLEMQSGDVIEVEAEAVSAHVEPAA